MASPLTIGMSVPGASGLMDAMSPSGQVGAETDEQRKKRLQAMQTSKQQPGVSELLGTGYGSAMGG